jgi:ubiquinone/menaquinone biosynthesis C-methylase UbiE
MGSDSKDAILMAGPMNHLIEAADRRLAILEAVRVLRPGGTLAVIAINRGLPISSDRLSPTG